ncbi:MAG: OmpA family protein [Kangiellaceae bacterium]|nr:OmpA family protein [Kangiellaceae bacterium]
MQNFTKLAVMLMALTICNVNAEEETNGVYISAGYNWFNFDDDRALLDDEDDLFVGLGYQINDNVALELKYSDFGSDFYSLNSVYRFEPRSENSFFWKLGITRYDDFVDDRGGLNLGAGYEAHFNEKLSMTLGVDSVLMFNDDYTDWVPYIGFNYFFGDVNSKPAPAPKPVAPVVKDSDKDGVRDELDQCPNSATGVSVDANGCELDSDNDGVVDSMDKCPNTPAGAKVDATGCRVMLTEDVSIKLNVQFANNSNVISDEYRQEIKRVADFMSSYPDTLVVIEGHTDSRGAASYNQSLSEKRAIAVMQYLVAEFSIDQARVSADGKGEISPIADNETAEGRATNRRVQAEIKTSVTKAQ